MRFPTMWYVRPAKAQPSLHICAVWSEPLLVAWIFYDCIASDWTSFGVSKLNRRLDRLVWILTCQNGTAQIFNVLNFDEFKNFVTSMYKWQCQLKIVSMIRKYHNHKLQTTPWHREEEPLNHHKTPGRQIKQSNQLSLPHQDDCNTRMDIKLRKTKHRTITDSHNGSNNKQKVNNNRTTALERTAA